MCQTLFMDWGYVCSEQNKIPGLMNLLVTKRHHGSLKSWL